MKKTIAIARVPIKVSRVPIKVKRIPIKMALSPEERKQRLMEKVQAKKEELKIVTKTEKAIMEIAKYYEYKCRVINGVSGWRCLSKNFKQHKNWIHLTRIYELCQTNNWDYKVYLDSQFYRVRNWKHKAKYPYLSHCYSQAAVIAYKSYIEDYQQSHSVTGDAKVKSTIPKNYRDEIIESVIKDCDHFVKLQQTAQKSRKYKGLTPQQIKFMYITDNVSAFSQYYWASIPWAVDYLNRFESPWIKDLVDLVQNIQQSKAMMKLIKLVVSEVEQRLGIIATVIPEVD